MPDVIDLLESDSSDDDKQNRPSIPRKLSEGSSQNDPIELESSDEEGLVKLMQRAARTAIRKPVAAAESTTVVPLKRPPAAVVSSPAKAVDIDSSDDEVDMELHIEKLRRQGKGVALLETLVKKEPKIEMVDRRHGAGDERKKPTNPRPISQSQGRDVVKDKLEVVDERKRPADPNRGRAQKTDSQSVAATQIQKQIPAKDQRKQAPLLTKESKQPNQSENSGMTLLTKYAAKKAATPLQPASIDHSGVTAKKAAPKRPASHDVLCLDDSSDNDDGDNDDDDRPKRNTSSSKRVALNGKVVSIDDSSDDGDSQTIRPPTKSGTSQEFAIYLSSGDDDSESDDGRECMRAGKTHFASRFNQLSCLASPSSEASQIKNWGNTSNYKVGLPNQTEAKPLVKSTVFAGTEKFRRGHRKTELDENKDTVAPLDRNGHYSRLGFSIKQNGTTKRTSRQPIDSSDEASCSSKGQAVFLLKHSNVSRKISSSEKGEGMVQTISSGSDDGSSKVSDGARRTPANLNDGNQSHSWSSGSEYEDATKGAATFQMKKPDRGVGTEPSNDAPPEKAIRSAGAANNREGSYPGNVSTGPVRKCLQAGNKADVRRPKKTSRKSTGRALNQRSESKDIRTCDGSTQLNDAVLRVKKTPRKSIGPIGGRKPFAGVEEESDYEYSLGSEEEVDIERHTTTFTAISTLSKRRRQQSSRKTKGGTALEECLQSYDPRVRKETKRKEREEAPTPPLEAEEESADTFVMIEVPHLGGITYRNGLPFQRITVYANNDDSILYDFEVNIKQSRVSKNAGLGAFLMYRGARVLDKQRKKVNLKKLDDRDIFNPTTLEYLAARRQDGSTVSIQISGKHLHGHNNAIFRTPTEVPLRASVYKTSGRQKMTVRLHGKNLHHDIDEDGSFDLSCCPKRFGRLCLNVESDYTRDNTIPFSAKLANSFSIELGRYGPVRKTDRKNKVDFDTKSFLFDHEPSGWDFGVEEQLLGRDQMIDITDDGTGEPHREARKQPAIYVNEVGHNTKLVQNVSSSTVGGNVVQYYMHVRHAMKRGQEVELLSDYFATYELNRERKGYGKANLTGESKSDCDLASRLKRNFIEREGTKDMVSALDPLELFYNLEFLSYHILPHLAEGAKNVFTIDVQVSLLTPRQLIARRRMHWMAPLYLQRVTALEGAGFKKNDDASTKASKAVVAEMLIKCKELIEDLAWNDLHCQSLPPIIPDKKLNETFEMESVDEVLYYVKDQLEDALDVNMWCPIARDLTKSLCKAAFEQLRFGQRICSEKLAVAFLKCASHASGSIHAAKKSKSYSQLSFLSGSEGGLWVSATQKNLVVLGAGATLSNSHVMKGATSALMDAQAYADLCELGCMTPMFDTSHTERTCDGPVVVTLSPLARSRVEGVPRRVDFVSQECGEINEHWYLLWQNVYLVHVMFSGLVQKFALDLDHQIDTRFLQQLCRATHIDVSEANAAIASGVRRDLASPQTVFRSTFELNKRKGKKATSTPTGKRKAARATNPRQRKVAKPRAKRTGGGSYTKHFFFKIVWSTLTQLEWTLIVGNRPTDYYFLPKGVTRGKGNGFKNRIDFFDSTTLVMNFIKNDIRWKDNLKVRECVALYEGCQKYMAEKKVKGQFKIDWVIEQVKELQKV